MEASSTQFEMWDYSLGEGWGREYRFRVFLNRVKDVSHEKSSREKT